MISPISSQASAWLQQSAPVKQQPSAALAQSQSSKSEDTVHLSAQAKAALAGGDVDHDGDGH